MRVSSSMLYNTGLQGLLSLQDKMFQAQNQMATGRRIMTPADDPIGAWEALEVAKSQGVNEQYLENQANAQMKIGAVDTVVDGIGERLTRIIELAAEADGPSSNDSERGKLAAEIKLNFDSILEFANARDGTGQYVFAGNKTAIKDGPFAENAAATPPYEHAAAKSSVDYRGDAGVPVLQVSASKQMPVSVSGTEMFMQVRDGQGNVLDRSMFDSIKNLITLVDPADGVAFNAAAMKSTRADLAAGLDHVANIRATLGARMNALDGLTGMAEDVDYLYSVRLLDLQDLDYTEAISRFTRLQTQLEASQLTFKQTSQLSLFNIL